MDLPICPLKFRVIWEISIVFVPICLAYTSPFERASKDPIPIDHFDR